MEEPFYRLLTDENIDPVVIAWLRANRFDVKDIKEELLYGISDEAVLDLATAEKRLVITHDSDFGKIVFTGYLLKTGIIFLRPGHINPQIHITSLIAVFDAIREAAIPYMLVAENSGTNIKIRIRNL